MLMSHPVFASPRLLRATVWFDASSGLLLGALHLLLTEPLSQWLGLPAALLQATGVILLAYAALAASIASARNLPRGRLWLLICGNLAWSAASLVLWLAMPPATLTGLGQAYLAVHVVSVALLADLQWWGARRLPTLAVA